MAELDHVRVVEVVQVHPHHRFGNIQHLHNEISNSHQDVILGGGGPLGANVAVDEHAVVWCGLQTDEMLVGLEVAKDGLAERNRSTREPAVDLRNSRRDMRLLLSSDLTFMGITHVRGHESSLVVRLSAVDVLPELGKEVGGAWCRQGGRRLSQASCQSGLPAPTQEGPLAAWRA